MDAGRRRRPAPLPGNAGSRRSRSGRAGRAGRRRRARPSRASSTPSCARSHAIARLSSPRRTRSTTTRRIGSRRAGARLTATKRRAPSPPRTAASRPSTSASRAIPQAGLSGSAASFSRRDRCASIRISRSRNSKAMPRANGGCRTPPQRFRLGFSARIAGQRVVDLCAAPGGKSAELAAAGATVTTVDRSAERLKMLAANFERLKLHADIVVADALTFDGAPFDATLVDAPCSATGTIRRHPDVAWLKRPTDLPGLLKLQGQLLDKAVALTRPGGPIVYCTCSLEPEEGEAQIVALLRRNPDVRRSPIAPDEIGGLTRMPDSSRRSAHAALPFVERRPAALRARRILRRTAHQGRLRSATRKGRSSCRISPQTSASCSPTCRFSTGSQRPLRPDSVRSNMCPPTTTTLARSSGASPISA